MVQGQLSRRGFLRMSAMIALGTAAAGCAPVDSPGAAAPAETSPEIVEIELWNGIGPPEGILMEDFMNQFAESRPDLKVTQWTTEWESFYTKIRTTYAEGIGPDLAITHPRYLAQYGGTVFKAVDDLVEADAELNADMFAEKAWEAPSYEGAQYGLPLDLHCFALYGNVGLLDEAGLELPQNEDDLVQVAKALTEAPDQWGMYTRYQGGGLLWEWMSYMAHHGQRGLLNEENTEAAFNGDAGIEALQRMFDNIHLDNISWGPDEGLDDYQAFLSQTCALRVGGTWEKFSWDENEDLQYTSTVFLPQQPGSWGSSHIFVFPRMGEASETDAAWDAAKYILQNHSVDWGVRAGHVPALVEAATSPEYTSIEQMQGFRDSLADIVFLPKVAQHETVSEILISNLNAAMFDQMSIEEALSNAETQVNEALAQA